jgi:NAD(P)-dependent dehydrogenase (short-subunit alcohol dehydrogenase family)
MSDSSGRVVMICGANCGIGRAISERLLAEHSEWLEDMM